METVQSLAICINSIANVEANLSLLGYNLTILLKVIKWTLPHSKIITLFLPIRVHLT